MRYGALILKVMIEYTLVKRVRKKLGVYSDMIKTMRGMGYIFDEIKN